MAIILKPENVAQLVLSIRGGKVLLDADLAMLYGVTTKALNQAVKRNSQRFPSDFMFQLTKAEHDNMRSRIVTISQRKSLSRSQNVTLKRGQNVKIPSLRFHRAGCRDAFQRSAEFTRRAGKHRNHANIRPASPPDGQ